MQDLKFFKIFYLSEISDLLSKRYIKNLLSGWVLGLSAKYHQM